MLSGRAFFFGLRGVVKTKRQPIMTSPQNPVLSSRQRSSGPGHHLWNNRGGWWFHGTEHRPDGTARRIRVNLRTKEVSKARELRDGILAKYGAVRAQG